MPKQLKILCDRIARNDHTETELDLSDAKVFEYENDLIQLAKALKTNTRLTKLSLKNCNISTDELIAVANMLMANTTLAFIDLSKNDICEEGIRALTHALTVNVTLQYIDDERYGQHFPKHLYEPLKYNREAVERLNNRPTYNDADDEQELNRRVRILARLKRQPKGFANLCQQIADNTYPRKWLNLSGKYLGTENTGKLAIALMKNTRITHLDLSNCWISESGIAALTKSLSHNLAIRYIRLSNNLSIPDDHPERLRIRKITVKRRREIPRTFHNKYPHDHCDDYLDPKMAMRTRRLEMQGFFAARRRQLQTGSTEKPAPRGILKSPYAARRHRNKPKKQVSFAPTIQIRRFKTHQI
ncbi:MAG: hypothetical protein CMF50_07240 [Legionellales bacterium]|nr:hypothetical protein [Legionellales bacterium]|tara:strand:+ start:35556 stop:36629 length:1074 start_codon:yes stop_codon:yes gene_type:complete